VPRLAQDDAIAVHREDVPAHLRLDPGEEEVVLGHDDATTQDHGLRVQDLDKHQQAAIEATASIIASLLAGANLVHDVGYLEAGLTSSFEMIVLADAVIGYGRAMLKDIEVTDETLALDVIDAVGHEGNYLAEDHTYRHFREVFYPDLLDRSNRENWLATGAPSMGDRLNVRVRELLDSHAPPPLSAGVSEELDGLVSEATERALRV